MRKPRRTHSFRSGFLLNTIEIERARNRVVLFFFRLLVKILTLSKNVK